MSRPRCELRATAAGRALDALEPEDERLVDEHLPHCAVCRRALREATLVASWLAVAVPAVEPPPGLRARVLARAAEEPGTPAAPPAAVTPPVPVTPPPPPVVEPRAPLDAVDLPAAPVRSGTSGRRDRRWGLLAVAAVVLGVVVLSARTLLPGSAPDVAAPPATSSAALADRAASIVQGAEAADPAGRQATLRDPAGLPVAVVVDDAGGARVVPLALPAPTAGSEYFLWRVVDSRTLPVGAVDAAAVSRTDAGPGTGEVSAYAISRETAGSRPSEPGVLVALGAAV